MANLGPCAISIMSVSLRWLKLLLFLLLLLSRASDTDKWTAGASQFCIIVLCLCIIVSHVHFKKIDNNASLQMKKVVGLWHGFAVSQRTALVAAEQVRAALAAILVSTTTLPLGPC